MTTGDLRASLQDRYGVEVSEATISAVTDKVWPLVEAWQNRSLASVYALVYLDALYVHLRREGRSERTAVYMALGVDLEGRKDALGHWVGDGVEGAKLWMHVLGELQARGQPHPHHRGNRRLHWMAWPAFRTQSGQSSPKPSFSAALFTRSAIS